MGDIVHRPRHNGCHWIARPIGAGASSKGDATMDPTLNDHDRAASRLIEARQRWRDSLAAARLHLAPPNLVRKAKSSVVETVQQKIKGNPQTVVAIGVALLTYLFRKPIFRAIRRLMKER